MSNETIPAAKILKLKGRSYTASPLSARDYVSLGEFLRDHHMEEAMRQAKKCGLPSELVKHAWDQAKVHSDKIQPGTAEFTEALNSPDGMAFMLWSSVKKAHPDFQLDLAMELIEENLSELAPKVASLAGLAEPSDPQKPA